MNRPLLFLILAGLHASPLATAQTMPQNNWRYDGLQFASPTNGTLGPLATGAGGVYVGEVGNGSSYANQVVRFTDGGVFASRFATTFTNIAGIASDPTGNVYVLDRGDSKVKMFQADGTFIRQWGGSGTGDGQFQLTGSSSRAMLTVDKNSQIYVCDPGNSRVQIFASDGSFVRKWGQAGSLPSQFGSGRPNTIAWSPRGELYLGPSPTTVVFSEDGTYLRSCADIFPYGTHFGGCAVAPDGLIAEIFFNGPFTNWGIFYADFVPIPNMDYSKSGLTSSAGSYAFSKRGDLYAVLSDLKTIRVYEREYSNVQNSLLPPAIPQPMVLATAQRAGTSWLDIDYQVTDADSVTASTGVLAFKDGGSSLSNVVVMNTLVEGTSANVGLDQPTGVPRRVTWNMAADWSVDFGQVQVEALAKDERNLLGINWITVPASGGDSAIQVSAGPITDGKLLDLWFWLLATHHPGISLDNGVVTGTTGVYAHQQLASGTVTTTAGRLFLYEQLGVRFISTGEQMRAMAGNYGFSAVDSTSIVKVASQVGSYVKMWGSPSYVAPASAGAIKVAQGGSVTFFLKSDGTLWGMGSNNYGQLGNGTTTSLTYPVQVATNVASVASGGNHTLFVKTDGSLWAMGYNIYGQLGDNSTTNRLAPVQVATGVASVAAGPSHSLFVTTDGTLKAMGANNSGQLGDNSVTNRLAPVQVATGVASVAAGSSHSLFVTTDGTLKAMGYNNCGQLGDNSLTYRPAPVQVATGVASVAAGSSHSLFVTTDGTLKAMGYNNYGQLGDASLQNRSVPVTIASGVVLIACGDNHSLFTKSDKTLWAMGYNSNGQLGDGTTNSRSIPLQVDVNASSIAAGTSGSSAVISYP